MSYLVALALLILFVQLDSDGSSQWGIGTPITYGSSQTLVETSPDPDARGRTSSKRKRDGSPLDSTRNARSFVAGGDGDSLPHYLTVSPTLFSRFPHAECRYRFPRAGSLSCGKLRAHKAYFDGLTVSSPGYTWGVLWELIRIHRLDPSQGITPGACRNLIGTNTTVGPNVKAILLETKQEDTTIPDLGKAERDAQVRGFGCILYSLG